MQSNVIVRIIVALLVLGIGLLGGWYVWERFFFKKQEAFSYERAATADNLMPIAIIGSGPAGLSAATYTGRAQFFTVIFQGKQPGGQLTGTSYVENWPGIPKMLGPDIMKASLEQATTWGAVTSHESIVKVDFSSWPYTLWTDTGTKVHAMAVILAMGAMPKRKGIPGEGEYWARGVSTCAVCDAPFFKDSVVAIIGGGDSAVEEALQLASYAKQITLLVRGDKMRASPAMQDRLKGYKNIDVRHQTDVTKIIGNDNFVTSIEIVSEGSTSVIPIDGVFLAIGHDPNTSFVRDTIVCDDLGYIVLFEHQETSKKGVFAAGDVVDRRYRQAGVAAGDGIKAALDAIHFLRNNDISDNILQQLKPRFFVPEKEGDRKPLASISTKAELDALLKKHSLVVLDFFTPTCYSCSQLLPALEGAAATFGDTAYFAKVDASVSLKLAQHLVVPKVPTIIVFKDGAFAARSKEVMTKRELLDYLQAIVKG